MRTLVACPFCREMFEPGEATKCPECDIPLKRLEDLPSTTVVADEVEAEIPPDEETLPWTYAGRGRGALVGVGLAGMAAFFMPWATMLRPEHQTLSGYQFAGYLGWMWAPFISWMVLLPLVLSRRCIYKMRGARVAVAFLCAMVVMTVGVRIGFPPRGTALDPINLEWRAGIWITAALGVVGMVLAMRFGGRGDDLASTKQKRPEGELLH
jgi:hypothetical protein